MSSRAQVAHLRPIAVEACKAFGLKDATLALEFHGYNTTWKVQAGDETFALRLNVNSSRTIEEIQGEIAWIEAIDRDTNVHVPKPLGMHVFRSPLLDKPLPAVLYRWLPGRHMKNRITPPTMAKLGTLMGSLHHHADTFTLPAGSSRPPLRNVLEGVKWRLPEEAVYLDPLHEANAALDKCKKQKPRLVHFDVHFSNLKMHQGELSVFDFDDTVLAWPIVDVAQTFFYARKPGAKPETEEAFWNAFGSDPAAHGLTDREFEALIVGRQLLLVNDMLGNMTAWLRAMAPEYVEKTRKRLERFSRTGYFDPS